ncbi:MAG: hypothetical protein GF388_04945 [Candidatus Aegiribacteria sp.]|nr:hypothetical protein [Candidatus Aegiribacteria sp.]MBD3294567.1 hypothetical protein [Candidatus Fermentibacteria bacterium]
MLNTVKERFPVALTACAAAVVLRTDPFFVSAFLLYSAGMVLYDGWKPGLAALAALAGISVMAQSSAAAFSFLFIGSFLAAVSCESRIRCLPFIASCLVAVLSGSLQGIAVYAIALSAVLALGSLEYRRYAMIASVILAVLLFGPPEPVSHGQFTAAEMMEDQRIRWLCPVEMDLGTPSVLLDAGGAAPEFVGLELSSGGVRDTLPVGVVISGMDTVAVRPGSSILMLEDPAFPVEVTITRERKPFTHPVIHLISAGTLDE